MFTSWQVAATVAAGVFVLATVLLVLPAVVLAGLLRWFDPPRSRGRWPVRMSRAAQHPQAGPQRFWAAAPPGREMGGRNVS
jgi:hypothetical protein